MKTKTKVAFFITGLNIGGAEALVRDLVVSMDRDKFEPIVISILNNGVFKNYIKDNGVRVFDIIKPQENKINFFIILIRLIKLLRLEKPHILQNSLFHAEIFGRIAGKIAGVPVIISCIQNVSFGNKFRDFFIFLTDWMVDASVAVSQLVYEYAIKNNISKKNKMVVIYNNVNTKFFSTQNDIDSKIIIRKKLGINNGKFILVTVGRLVKQKGFIYLLESIKILQQERGMNNFNLFIVGEGVERSVLEKFISDNMLSDTVFLTGAVLNVEEYLQSADVFVMSSLWEGCSIATIEATAVGLPVIATNVGIVPEIIKDKDNGLIVEIGNPKSLADKIESMIKLPSEKRVEMGIRARKITEELFSVSKIRSDYESYYEKFNK
jgi:glycosyltransferase involved in cell wall biosynthesis